MRINVIPAKYLSDQHLLAEFVELRMLKPMYIKSSISKNGFNVSKIPLEYTLNKGHGYFFYNKFHYVNKRFIELINELEYREYNIKDTTLDLSLIHKTLWNDFIPNKKDRHVNLERILQRIYIKPEWYTYNRKRIPSWEEFYLKHLNYKRVKND